MESVVELLQALVQIPSVNPDGDPGVSPDGEKKVALFVAKFLRGLGFETTLEEVQGGRPNLIGRAPGPADRPRILLAPHLDTVGVSGMTIDPFAAAISDGKIHGRGTTDTKGSMAAMLWGLRENADQLATLPVAVDFVGFMGEETKQPGSRHFASRHAANYQFAIAGEPTSLQAVYCTKGCLWATLQADGKSTHASQPHLGDNAILKLMAGLTSLQGDFQDYLAQSHHPLLGPATMNLGRISGGSRPNIVPDRAFAELDLRSVPALVRDRPALDILREFAGDLTVTEIMESPPMEMPEDHPWLTRLQEMMPGLALAGAPWFSDASHLSAAGLPSICLGPGSIEQAHTADEFIRIEDLEAGARWFAHLISRF